MNHLRHQKEKKRNWSVDADRISSKKLVRSRKLPAIKTNSSGMETCTLYGRAANDKVTITTSLCRSNNTSSSISSSSEEEVIINKSCLLEGLEWSPLRRKANSAIRRVLVGEEHGDDGRCRSQRRESAKNKVEEVVFRAMSHSTVVRWTIVWTRVRTLTGYWNFRHSCCSLLLLTVVVRCCRRWSSSSSSSYTPPPTTKILLKSTNSNLVSSCLHPPLTNYNTPPAIMHQAFLWIESLLQTAATAATKTNNNSNKNWDQQSKNLSKWVGDLLCDTAEKCTTRRRKKTTRRTPTTDEDEGGVPGTPTTTWWRRWQ